MGGAKPTAKFVGESSSDATLSDAATQGVGTSSKSDVTQGVGPSSNLDVILELGTVLGGRYEIVEMLGIGGMGAVYKARDRALDRIIALKVMRPELARNPEVLQRFKQELLTARQVTHKNVIRIFDLAEADGIQFITMEYVAGPDLRTLLHDHGKFPPPEAVDIIRQVCTAVAAAHAEGVIHRDLKPGNIMRDAQGRVVVMDFGLARNIVGDGMTKTGAMLGTVEYMSPEQAKAEKLDARSDLFTIGIIFYELLTGNTPYKADSVIASLLKRTQEAAVPAYQTDSSVPRALSDILGKALERDPAQRYQSVQEFIDHLDEYEGRRPASSVGVARPSGIAVAPFMRKRWMLIGVAAVLVLVFAVAAKLWMMRSRTTTTTGPHAPVSVLVADFTNHTGDPVFDGTLEPMFNVALEGASFINAFSRGQARKLAEQLPKPTDKLDEQSARLIATSQGLGAVVTGSLSRRGDGYRLHAEAMDAVTGNTIANADVSASTKDEVLLAVPKLAAPIRKALGDTTPESVQLAAAETFTAGSLEAAHEYALAQEESFGGKNDDALSSYSKALQLDPNFGRAYSGMAVVYRRVGQLREAEKYFKLAMEHVDRMSERERYRTRGGYYLTIGNFQKCVEEFSALVTQYPSDNTGHNNVAFCFFRLGDPKRALEHAKRALEISPKSATLRMNVALFSLYAGEFEAGEREARQVLQLNPAYEKAYLTLGYAQLVQGQLSQAAETYQRIAKISKFGASLASSGLGDLAVYEGRFSDAVKIFEEGAATELAAKTPDPAAAQLAALAQVRLLLGQKRLALAALQKAVANGRAVKLRFLAARIYVAAGEVAKARQLAGSLASELQTEPQVYAKLIEGEVALRAGDMRKAIQVFTEANNLLDTWIGRFDLGRAYLEAGLFTEADSEFDRCVKRRGEALELFVDDVPTYGYFPEIYYYQGRVREALKSPGAADSYRTYLSIRGKAGEDHLLPEIHRRLGQ
jgi:tetratricopeptide (TPR) repeat protein